LKYSFICNIFSIITGYHTYSHPTFTLWYFITCFNNFHKTG
jgi:hypothetical protein